MPVVRFSVVIGLTLLLSSSAFSADPVKPKVGAAAVKPKLTKWNTIFENATKQARKEKKFILAYFSGSDWEPYTQKLEKDVLNTELFQNWADQHIVLFNCDFPKEKKQSPIQIGQAKEMRQRYSIIKIPQFILMDFGGVPFARGAYDEVKLRDDEPKGEPRAFIKWIEESIKNKAPDEDLVRAKNLTEALTYGKKHFISAVFVIYDGHPERETQARDDLLHNQAFVRYMNRNVAFAEIEWPYDSDTRPEASEFRLFAAKQNLERVPLQLVVWDMQTNKVNFRLKAVNPARADKIVEMVEAHLPKIDYNNGWVEDYRQVTAIAQQQKRYIMLAFTSYDSSEFSRKMNDEIFETPEFKKFARKRLVTAKVDFPTATTQPATLAGQNKTLAEMYAVRGFPYIVILNPLGQKIAESKYQKGGPENFIKEMQAAMKVDEDRRAFLAGQAADENAN